VISSGVLVFRKEVAGSYRQTQFNKKKKKILKGNGENVYFLFFSYKANIMIQRQI
jgi:hypothetical protein